MREDTIEILSGLEDVNSSQFFTRSKMNNLCGHSTILYRKSAQSRSEETFQSEGERPMEWSGPIEPEEVVTAKASNCFKTTLYKFLRRYRHSSHVAYLAYYTVTLGTIEKQVFDFLGYMWAPIIMNSFQIICTIFGIFGTYQYKPKFIAVYSTWSLIWLGWNIFVICLYLEVGVLNRNRDINILSIGTKNKSWWLQHGVGCRISNDSWVDNIQQDDARKIPPEDVIEGCVLAYYYVEVIHAGVQCLLALTGFVFTCMAIYIFADEQQTTSTANDVLEFVKMQAQTSVRTQHHPPPTSTGAALNPAFEADTPSVNSHTTHTEYQNDYPTYDHPPSYETSMRNNVNQRYGSDRQSVRSARSTRSKASTRSKRVRRQEERQERQDLPWVQIMPSSSNSHSDTAAFRHFP